MSPQIRKRLAFLALVSLLTLPVAQSTGLPNNFLPTHVEAEHGKVSLYADYDAVEVDGRVPVYLVNKTSVALVLNTQDGDIYLKQEYQDASGRWVRSQPHAYSWCGNSYVQMTLMPNSYVVVRGYQPINGQQRQIRYNLYSQDIEIASNVGDGIVADADIERASTDVMSVSTGSFDYVAGVAMSDLPIENNMDHMRDLRDSAIRQLASGRFDSKDSRDVLLMIRDRRPELAQEIDYSLRRLDKQLAAAADSN